MRRPEVSERGGLILGPLGPLRALLAQAPALQQQPLSLQRLGNAAAAQHCQRRPAPRELQTPAAAPISAGSPDGVGCSIGLQIGARPSAEYPLRSLHLATRAAPAAAAADPAAPPPASAAAAAAIATAAASATAAIATTTDTAAVTAAASAAAAVAVAAASPDGTAVGAAAAAAGPEARVPVEAAPPRLDALTAMRPLGALRSTPQGFGRVRP